MSGPSFINMNNKHLILIFSAIYFDGKESDSLRWVDGKNQLERKSVSLIIMIDELYYDEKVSYPLWYSLKFIG